MCVCVPQRVSVGAIVLLDEDCSSSALLELPLLMETPETALDQNGCQGHPLIKCILREIERERGDLKYYCSLGTTQICELMFDLLWHVHLGRIPFRQMSSRPPILTANRTWGRFDVMMIS